ncbi:MAG: YdcF family protein [Nitratireductor sp.]
MANCTHDNDGVGPVRTLPATHMMQGIAIRMSQLLLLCMILALVALLVGFVQFYRGIASDTLATSIPSSSSQVMALPEHADGIVVLTGGSARIATAIELLEHGSARRLLISGVHPSSSLTAIRGAVNGKRETFDCCVDIDRAAMDTYGNAEETRKWAERYGFRSLIVVTSDYHMPRSLVEMRRTMPLIEFIPHSVNYGPLRADAWFANPGTLKIVASEYLKYLAALVRKEVSGSDRNTAFANVTSF